MNRWIYNIGFLLLGMSMLFLSACSDEVIPRYEPGDADEEDKEIPIMISMDGLSLSGASTYGTDYPGETSVEGSTNENIINDITVFVFDQSFNCEKILTATSSPTNPEMVKVGKKNFVAVVNAAGKMTLPAAGSESTVSYSSLLQTLTDVAATVPSSPFLMTGKSLNVSLPDVLPSTSPYNVSIDVERATAKVKLKVMKSGQAIGHNITLTRVIMYQGANRVALFEAPNPNTTLYNLSDTATTFQNTLTNVFSGAVPNSGSGYVAMVDSFYTYESLCASDKNKAVRIVLESYVNAPSNIRTAEFYLGEYSRSLGDTVYDVKRNYWYDVTVNIAKPGMDSVYVTINTCPWNTTDTIHRTEGEGAEYQTATPFKLVKNYTAADMMQSSDCAVIDTHTKGASWIDLKVTSGTSWALKLKDNTARNQYVIGSADDGTSWTNMAYNGAHLSGVGTDVTQRIYIYRLYQEDAEPEQGPTLYLEVGGSYKTDFIIQPRDTAPIPTNCYIMRPQLAGTPLNETRTYIPLAGVYRYWEDFLMANGDSIPDGTISAVLLWQDHSGTVVKNLNVVNANKRDSAYIYAEAGDVQGSAVIGMRVGGTIYWSFHLWVTEYNPYDAAGQKLYTHTKNVFMDRNLGALTNDSIDINGESRGLYYQFGRKDPFPRGSNWSGSFIWWYNASGIQQSTITTSTSLAPVSTLRPKSAINTAIQNPMTFYNVSSWPLYLEDENLWLTSGGNKTAFDPCPEGYRIPIQTSASAAGSPWYEIALAANGEFRPNMSLTGRTNSNLGFYPVSGYVTGITNNEITRTDMGHYRTSWANNATSGIVMTFTNIANANVVYSLNNSYGASVRCVVDVEYLKRKANGGVFTNRNSLLNVTQ